MVDGLWMEFPPTDPRYNAFEYRRLLYMLTGGQQGVSPGLTGLKVSQWGAGANMSVDVATGSAVVLSTESVRESYQATFPTLQNVVVPAAHASGVTKHLVVFRIQNQLEFAGAANTATIELLAGTSGANTDPTLTDNSLLLARLTIPAAVSSVVTGHITDLRTLLTPVCIVNRSAGLNVTNNTATDVTWDNEQFDPNNMHAANSATITIPCYGRWHITFDTFFDAPGGAFAHVDIECDGRVYRAHGGSDSAARHSNGISPILNAGDTVKLVAQQATGSTLALFGRLTVALGQAL